MCKKENMSAAGMRCSVDLDAELTELFQTFLRQNGWIQYKVLLAAVRAFIALPSEVCLRVINANSNDLYPILVEGLLGVELRRELDVLDSLGLSEKEFLIFLRAVKQRLSEKRPKKN